MQIAVLKTNRQGKQALTVQFFGLSFPVTDDLRYSFTAEEAEATRFPDRYEIIGTVLMSDIPGGYAIAEAKGYSNSPVGGVVDS